MDDPEENMDRWAESIDEIFPARKIKSQNIEIKEALQEEALQDSPSLFYPDMSTSSPQKLMLQTQSTTQRQKSILGLQTQATSLTVSPFASMHKFPLRELELKKLDGDSLKSTNKEFDPSDIDISQMETNHGYLFFFIMSFQFACTFQGGWALCECGQAALVLDKKLGWNAITEDESQRQLVNMVTIATMLGPLGIAIGSVIAGKLMHFKGSRRLVIVANFIALVGNCIKLVENTWAILVGRLIFGLMSGITNVCISKVINDTVPVKNQQQYGSIVNGGFMIGIWASNFAGMLIPLDNGEEGAVKRMIEDQNWRIVFGLPIVFELYSIIVLLFVIKHDSIIDLIQKKGTDSPILLQLLKKVYTIPDSITYEDLAVRMKFEIKEPEANPTTIMQAFKERKHRRSSCMAVLFPIANQLTGIDGILLFQTQIYLKMKRDGQLSIPVIWGVQITNIINMFAAFLYPMVQKYFRQKQALIFGHIGMTVCLFAIVVFEVIKQNMLILVALQLFIVFFNYGVGCIMVIHIFETNVDSIVGLGILSYFGWVTVITILAPMLLDEIGVTGLFLFFGIGSLIGTIFIIFFIRGTNYIVTHPDGSKEIKQLSERDKKELYWPKEFKSKSMKQMISEYILAKVESEKTQRQQHETRHETRQETRFETKPELRQEETKPETKQEAIEEVLQMPYT